MSLVGGIVVFILLWWLMLFTVLPLRIRRSGGRVPGQDKGAPDNPHLGFKLCLTTILAVISWGVVYGVIESGWFSLRP